MAEERPGSWFGFGFCGFGQALGTGRGRQVLSPEPLRVKDADTDICDICSVSAAWSYTAIVNRAGRVLLSGSVGGAAEGCRDAWASETLLAVLRDGRGPGSGAELQAWAPGSALRGEPLWAQTAVPEAGREDDGAAGCGARAGPLPLLPCARAYLSPRPPLHRPLAPALRARRLALGSEHALLLDAAGQVHSWGGGRDGRHLCLGLERVGAAGPARQEPGRGQRDRCRGRAVCPSIHAVLWPGAPHWRSGRIRFGGTEAAPAGCPVRQDPFSVDEHGTVPVRPRPRGRCGRQQVPPQLCALEVYTPGHTDEVAASMSPDRLQRVSCPSL